MVGPHCALLGLAPLLAGASALAAPPPFDTGARETLLALHAVGSQIYECKADPAGHLVWAFREPIATLIGDGKTVGRHYGGPTWAVDEGGAVKGKVLSTAPGAGPKDIPLLELEVVEHRGTGILEGASRVLRLNTHGGALKGSCGVIGELRAEPYSADYVFLR
jgi:hypothetical protein